MAENVEKDMEMIFDVIIILMIVTTIIALLFSYIQASSETSVQINTGVGYKTAGFFIVSNDNGELGLQDLSELKSRINSCNLNEDGLREGEVLSVGAGRDNCITQVNGAESLSLESIMYSEEEGFYPLNIVQTSRLNALEEGPQN